jgi:ribosomal-protein-alanine N-acetyltransferase
LAEAAQQLDDAVLETPRLALRRFEPADAAFIHELVNDPAWIRYIGDKNIRSLEDARRYIENGPMKMYAERGFGLWRVDRKSDGVALGMCGLVKREQLADVDLGFAFLPRHWGQGYARESAEGVVRHAREALGIGRLVAITSPGNAPSAKLLEKLGFRYESDLDFGRNDPVRLYGLA